MKKGVAQDASLIVADPGSSGKPRGEGVLRQRSRDGCWGKRVKGSVFDYKLHMKKDLEIGLVLAVEATSASLYDDRVDLSTPSEAVYCDKEYFGVDPCGFDATIMRGVCGHPLCLRDRLRNLRIGLKRRRVERTFAVLKLVFHTGRVRVWFVGILSVNMVASAE